MNANESAERRFRAAKLRTDLPGKRFSTLSSERGVGEAERLAFVHATLSFLRTSTTSHVRYVGEIPTLSSEIASQTRNWRSSPTIEATTGGGTLLVEPQASLLPFGRALRQQASIACSGGEPRPCPSSHPSVYESLPDAEFESSAALER